MCETTKAVTLTQLLSIHLFIIHVFVSSLLGVNIRAPNGDNNTGTGGICPAGHECPQGTAVPMPCLAGLYAKDVQMDACEICPAGESYK